MLQYRAVALQLKYHLVNFADGTAAAGEFFTANIVHQDRALSRLKIIAGSGMRPAALLEYAFSGFPLETSLDPSRKFLEVSCSCPDQ